MVKLKDQTRLKAERRAFVEWLRKHASLVRDRPIHELLKSSGRRISPSAAYRIAVREGVRGQRRNRGGYSEFWQSVNWDLPDLIFSVIWSVDRGNLRQRRISLRAGKPRFRADEVRHSKHYLNIVNKERMKAERFTGSRPR